VSSRTEAKRLLDDGVVEVRGMPTPKAASLVSADTPIEMSTTDRRYVSRGAFKLAGALDDFGIDPNGRRVLDAGSSTGGFTEVLLERGAVEVVALDVGHGQLDQALRSHPRVLVMERTNLRHVTPDDTGGRFPLIVADLSFISLCTVAEALAGLSEPGGDLVLLVKPQFEAGKGEVGRGGIVRDDSVRRRAVEKVVACLGDRGLGAVALTPSRLPGVGGNREVFVWCHAGRPASDLEVPG
jgi:23S rRNA (cytidine1920-2'-O)/16S rRNA (cytidine1409-2'-O)-methyltransferase